MARVVDKRELRRLLEGLSPAERSRLEALTRLRRQEPGERRPSGNAYSRKGALAGVLEEARQIILVAMKRGHEPEPPNPHGAGMGGSETRHEVSNWTELFYGKDVW